MNDGAEWLKISHIPGVIVDRQRIIPKATWDEIQKVGIEFKGENQANAFPSLKKLCFVDMAKWEEWDIFEVDK
ncbi:hypothetical protein Goshw_001912, partial [Gossypium schwendimanii]|nr:hypothetical protein [Gossypium schwendimanii]